MAATISAIFWVCASSPMVVPNKQIRWVFGWLGWTEVGGDLLTIETALMPGKDIITHQFAG